MALSTRVNDDSHQLLFRESRFAAGELNVAGAATAIEEIVDCREVRSTEVVVECLLIGICLVSDEVVVAVCLLQQVEAHAARILACAKDIGFH